MKITPSSVPPISVACISVPKLAEFDMHDPGAVAVAFEHSPVLPMGQAWRAAPEPGLLAGNVRVGWRDAHLLVFADLPDAHIFSRATADNQHMWTLGDVFEMFLRDVEAKPYIELHVTPTGNRMQLRFAGAEAFEAVRAGQRTLEEMFISEPLFEYALTIHAGRWQVCAAVPARALENGDTDCGDLKGRSWLASFSRYDYSTMEGPPVLSSTSPHAKLDFHRQQEWLRLRFD